MDKQDFRLYCLRTLPPPANVPTHALSPNLEKNEGMKRAAVSNHLFAIVVTTKDLSKVLVQSYGHNAQERSDTCTSISEQEVRGRSCITLEIHRTDCRIAVHDVGGKFPESPFMPGPSRRSELLFSLRLTVISLEASWLAVADEASLSTSTEGAIQLYRISRTGPALRLEKHHLTLANRSSKKDHVNAISFSSQGERIICTTSQNRVLIWTLWEDVDQQPVGSGPSLKLRPFEYKVDIANVSANIVLKFRSTIDSVGNR